MSVPQASGGRSGFRAQHRQRRIEEFIETALQIVTSEGLTALTMQRVTREIGCAEGAIYHYFRTKGALIAAVQERALAVLGTAVAQCMANTDAQLQGRRLAPATIALDRVFVGAMFWISAEDTYREEIDLCRRMFNEPVSLLADEDAKDVLPPAFALLSFAEQLFDDAVRTKALRPGDSTERAILVLAGTTGVLLTSDLRRWNHDVFDGRRLAEALLRDLFTAWGASPRGMSAAWRLVDQMARRGELVPRVPRFGDGV